MNPSEYARRTYERQIHARFSYLGCEVWQTPADLAAMQWVIGDLAPLLVIELGTYYGGHARFMADAMDAADGGHVVTVDSADYPDAPGAYRPEHERITYLSGRTDDGAIIGRCQREAAEWDGPVMVLHDACHEGPQVLDDLRLYGPLVTPGSWLVCADTNLDIEGDRCVFPNGEWGQGPAWALARFLEGEPPGRWEVTRSMERFGLSANPDGYVRRMA